MSTLASQPNVIQQDLESITSDLLAEWEELRDGRLFITGGTGFFGRWLLESFSYANRTLGLNAEAVVLSRDPEVFARKAPALGADPAISFITGDIRQLACKGQKFSHMIHAATDASATLNEEKPLMMFDTIVEGTRRALEFAREAGVRKLLLTSSGAIYGPQPAELTTIPESFSGGVDPTKPNSAYGEGKRVAELLAALYFKQYGIETKIARCFTFVGPFMNLDAHFAIGNFIRDAVSKKTISIAGDGMPLRSYLYSSDLTRWLWKILFSGVPLRPYNVGSGESISIRELAELVAKQAGPDVKVELRAEKKSAATSGNMYVPNVGRIECELDLRQLVSLAAGIDRTISWHRSKLEVGEKS